MQDLICAAALLIVASWGAGAHAQPVPTKPSGLQPGATIMLIAPSGEVNRAKVERARRRLEERGYKVVVPAGIAERTRGYLAGSDATRAAELMSAFRDPEVDAVFSITGGYGTTRILDLLDYDTIARHPKIFTGFSDITGLHLALGGKCNLVTFHAPNLEYGLGSEDGLPAFHAHYFWQALLATDGPDTKRLVYEPPRPDLPIRALRPGVAQGRTVGGNLSLIAALIGTPYEIETAGRVLFLEDIREAPYRVDRMLSQLKLAGKLSAPAAVVLGAFYRCDAEEGDSSLTLAQIWDDYFGTANYPVLLDFPAGHGPWNATLPLGVMAEVDGDQARLTLLESPLADP